ncbi:MAG TPA: hypothetical protein VK668_13935 [Mucilaginibacter sp.]|nr:hypothetical protein [Mucilaginibacter sp.]
MKRKIFITTALVSCFLFCLAAIADLSGKWRGTVVTPDGKEVILTYNFKVDGNKLTGTGESNDHEIKIDSGQVNGTDIKFSVTNTEGILIPHHGKYFANGDSVSMNLDFQGAKFHATLKRVDK